MYINITIDLKNYDENSIELRLSNQYSIKNLIDIVWQTKKISEKPREGFWIKNKNKNKVNAGNQSLKDSGITTGDCIEIL